jgi:hypothetical protein
MPLAEELYAHTTDANGLDEVEVSRGDFGAVELANIASNEVL